MAILFCDDTYRSDKLYGLLQENMPGVDLRRYPDVGNPEDIDYAVIWRPKAGSLQGLPKLKVIFTTSAGVDGIIRDTTLPDVPIVRNTDTHLVEGIRNYCVYHVLRYQRFFRKYEKQHPEKIWKQYPQLDAVTCTIGFLGMGTMAENAARHLYDLGFTIRSWSRTEKHIDGIRSFYGTEQQKDFLNGTQILINLLPLTDDTHGILNAELFAQLPKGAMVINIGRGEHLVEQDLIDALDSNHLEAATLDVFKTEPLPENDPLWTHPKITITPHIASLTDYKNLCANILKQIADFENGLPLKNVVDIKRQY